MLLYSLAPRSAMGPKQAATPRTVRRDKRVGICCQGKKTTSAAVWMPGKMQSLPHADIEAPTFCVGIRIQEPGNECSVLLECLYDGAILQAYAVCAIWV